MRRTAFAVAAALVLLAQSSGLAAATYSQDVYLGYYAVQYHSDWCVPASALTWIDYLTGSTDVSLSKETSVNGKVTTGDKYPHTTGHDPRGWAYALHSYVSTYEFNDFRYSSANQMWANWELVDGVRATGRPTGAVVLAGLHAVDVTGYQTLYDPFSTQQQTLYGIRIVDPWYNSGLGSFGHAPWPNSGYSPDSYIALATWNGLYLRVNQSDEAYWNGYYTIVARGQGTGAPSDIAPDTYTTYADQVNPNGRLVAAAPVIAGSIEAAVSQGISGSGLDSANPLGLDLHNFAVGEIVHVDSMTPAFPSYDLVDVTVNGRVTAVAVVAEDGDGYQFAELTGVQAGFQLPDAAVRYPLLQSRGYSGAGRLAWGFSDESMSPFVPFITAADAAGAVQYLTPNGWATSLHLLPVPAFR